MMGQVTGPTTPETPDPWGVHQQGDQPAEQPAAPGQGYGAPGAAAPGQGYGAPGAAAPGQGYGAPAAGYPAYPQPLPTSSKANTVMVLGIVSLVSFFALCGIGIVPAVIALAMAPGARREIAAAGGALAGERQVRAGVVMSWITVGLAALGLVVVIVLVVVLVAASDSSTSVDTGIGALSAARAVLGR